MGKSKLWYLLGSIGAALFFLYLFDFYGYGPLKSIRYVVLMGMLVPIAYKDYKEKRIPNRWLVYMTAIRGGIFMIEAILYPSAAIENLKYMLAGGLVGFLVLFLAYILSRHEIGLGDVKLFTVIGLYLGVGTTYFVLLASLILAALYGGVKMLRKQLKGKDEIAFAPFTAIAAVLILGLGF